MMHFKTLLLTGVLCLHTTALLPAASVVLNEYNAVSGNNRLNGGTGRDITFGSIFGNGGNWFELLVIDDHVDMRGWNLVWHEDEQVNGETATGTLTLADNSIWSDLRSGTLLTFIETINAGGEDISTATDISYDPSADDWWIHVSTQGEAGKGEAALVTTVTNDGVPGDFSTGNADWTLTIADSGNQVIFGPAGEGASWAGGGISGEEIGKLEGPTTDDGSPVTLAMWQAVTPASSFYDDAGSSSFGQINQSYDSVTQVFTPVQDVSALRSVIEPPLGDGDFDDDGALTGADIDALTAEILAAGTDLKYDVNLDGSINADDRQAWVEGLKRTYFGDSNLDLEFNSTDLVAVLAAGEYEDATAGNSGWGDGDWDGDGDFTTSDFVFALAGGGYEIGPRAAVAAVPEPTAWTMLAATLLAGRCWRRRR
jgi:hypothetical protein